MTVSGITSSSTMIAEMKARQKELQQDMSRLETALQAGDGAAAEKVLSKLESMKPKDAPSGPKGENPMEADMQAVEEALAAGNIDAARTAFAKLKAGFENGAKNGPPPPPSGAVGGATDVYASLFQSLGGSSSGDGNDTEELFSLLRGSDNSASSANTTMINDLLKKLQAIDGSSEGANATSSTLTDLTV